MEKHKSSGIMIKTLIRQLLSQKKTVLLIISTVFSLGLLIFRMIYTENITFIFLVWNLFLAWIPYIISNTYTKYDHQFKSRLMLFLTVMIWLPFFPNAPYILTDLFHLSCFYFQKEFHAPGKDNYEKSFG